MDLAAEWLEADGLGGFASGTVEFLPGRRHDEKRRLGAAFYERPQQIERGSRGEPKFVAPIVRPARLGPTAHRRARGSSPS